MRQMIAITMTESEKEEEEKTKEALQLMNNRVLFARFFLYTDLSDGGSNRRRG